MKAIVVGSGITGSVASRILAEKGYTVEVWEKKNCLGGAVCDYPDENGVFIHSHGPHIFHTNSDTAFEFVSRFTDWIDCPHKVLARIKGLYCPIPFNYTSIETCFEEDLAFVYKRKLFELAGENNVVTIGKLLKASDSDLRELANFVYEYVFLHYTEKQWGMSPKLLGEDVMGRVPVRASYDDRYFSDKYQVMPVNGYTEMIRKMLEHPNICIKYNYNALERMKLKDSSVEIDGNDFAGCVIYTGCIAELLDYRFGELPYRTLRFETETQPRPFQPTSVVNYPNDNNYTRITEFAHFYPDCKADKGTIMYEYPLKYTVGMNSDPYYPIPLNENILIYQKYVEALSKIKNIYPAGRLGSYKYINMDIAVLEGMKIANKAMEFGGDGLS